jgi:anaerobic selenocysteine-containing dehydrogenase
MKALIALDDAAGPGSRVLDHEFIVAHTHGFEAFATDLRGTEWSAIEATCGLSREALQSVAVAYAKSSATIISYGMGITQHSKGTSNVQQIANLLLLRGNFGKPGAGICPLRGHSNVQGDRTVGITEKPNAALLEAIERVFGFKPPQDHGHDALAAIQSIIEGRSKALVCLGGNLAVALPEPERCYKAMRTLDLAVHIGTKLNRSHLLVGKQSFILPMPRPHRAGYSGDRTAIHHRRGFDVDGACIDGKAAARPPNICDRSRPSWPAWRTPLCQTARFLGWSSSRTTIGSAMASRLCSRTSKTSIAAFEFPAGFAFLSRPP